MENTINFNLIEPIFKTNNVQFAGVFGSVARGEAGSDSDMDILVRFSEPISLLGLIRMERTLSEKIGRDVDLVTEDSLSPLMKEEVLHDLKTIYEKG